MQNNSESSPVIDIKNLGKLIRCMRKEKHLTQTEAAEKIGVSAQHYSRIERGEYTPGLQTFLSIVDILELDIAKLKLSGNKNFSSTMFEIVYLLERFNNTQQKAVLSLLKNMETVRT